MSSLTGLIPEMALLVIWSNREPVQRPSRESGEGAGSKLRNYKLSGPFMSLFRRRIGPKSILKKIGFEVLSDESAREDSTSEDEDPEHIIRLPNGMKFR